MQCSAASDAAGAPSRLITYKRGVDLGGEHQPNTLLLLTRRINTPVLCIDWFVGRQVGRGRS